MIISEYLKNIYFYIEICKLILLIIWNSELFFDKFLFTVKLLIFLYY